MDADISSLSDLPPDLSHVQSRDQLQSQVQAQGFFQHGSTQRSLSTTCSLRATYWAASPYSTMQCIECIFLPQMGGQYVHIYISIQQLRRHTRQSTENTWFKGSVNASSR